MKDGPSAGIALGLPSQDHPMACMAGGDLCADKEKADRSTLPTAAKGDLRTKAHFSKRSRAKAKKHWYRKTLQPCGPTKPVFPDPNNVEDLKFTLASEKAARKRAWQMAKYLNKDMGKFKDMDASFFKIMDPVKNSTTGLTHHAAPPTT